MMRRTGFSVLSASSSSSLLNARQSSNKLFNSLGMAAFASSSFCDFSTGRVPSSSFSNSSSRPLYIGSFRRLCPTPISSSTTTVSTSASTLGSDGLVAAQRRTFLFRSKNAEQAKVKVDEVTFDKQHAHWAGELFGVPMDKVVYYLKINGSVFIVVMIIYMFFQGYVYLSQFSLATVGKLGFMAGFYTCLALYSSALLVRRNYQISPNAVYNQAISLAMRNEQAVAHLGSSPRTGDFKAYCASGGFKLPLLRRLRSGQYSLSDLLGTKQRKLQMMFLLQSPTGGQEALVSCEVRKGSSGLFSSGYYFQSLSMYLTAPGKDPQSVILIGGEKDVVFKGILSLAKGAKSSIGGGTKQ